MNVSDEGEQLINAWTAAVDRASRLRDELRRAETDQRNAETALGRWLVPGDAAPGETFCVWFAGAGGDFRIGIRTRGRHGL